MKNDGGRWNGRDLRKWQAMVVTSMAVGLPMLLLLPSAGATFSLNPTYNEGCNGNPYGAGIQFNPIGTTTHALAGPALAGGYLNPGVGGNETASSVNSTSSAVLTYEYLMVGPHKINSSSSCWVPTTTKTVTATFDWQVNLTAYAASTCNSGGSAVASFDVYIVGNFHINHPPWYLITPVSPDASVAAFVVGCGGPYAPGFKAGAFSITTPGVLVTAGVSYDFYSAIWVYAQIQLNTPSGGSAYAAVSWAADLTSVTCNGC
ncbi:MAG: hypothetical protein WB809_00375 [Thermoplasmata archaeon]